MERETRLELATFSLEGWSSTNWATPAYSIASILRKRLHFLTSKDSQCCSPPIPKTEISYMHPIYAWWWGEDLNLRRLRRQIYSLLPLTTREPHQYLILEPAEGFEPPTNWLQISSSADWATLACYQLIHCQQCGCPLLLPISGYSNRRRSKPDDSYSRRNNIHRLSHERRLNNNRLKHNSTFINLNVCFVNFFLYIF